MKIFRYDYNEKVPEYLGTKGRVKVLIKCHDEDIYRAKVHEVMNALRRELDKCEKGKK